MMAIDSIFGRGGFFADKQAKQLARPDSRPPAVSGALMRMAGSGA